MLCPIVSFLLSMGRREEIRSITHSRFQRSLLRKREYLEQSTAPNVSARDAMKSCVGRSRPL